MGVKLKMGHNTLQLQLHMRSAYTQDAPHLASNSRTSSVGCVWEPTSCNRDNTVSKLSPDASVPGAGGSVVGPVPPAVLLLPAEAANAARSGSSKPSRAAQSRGMPGECTSAVSASQQQS